MKRYISIFLLLPLVLSACGSSVSTAPDKAVEPPIVSVNTAKPPVEVLPPTSVPPTEAPTATSLLPGETPSPILESDDQEEGNVGTVLMVFGSGFDYRHYEGTRAALERAGYRVLVASNTPGLIEGADFAHGYESMSRTRGFIPEARVDLLLKDVRVEDYQAIIFISDDTMMSGRSPEIRRIVLQAAENGVVLAAQEFALYILAGAGVLQGVEVTANPLICQQMEVDYGAICKLVPVQSHSRIITTGPTFSSVHFVQAIVEAIQEGG